jgi:signal transduction histidine kinase
VPGENLAKIVEELVDNGFKFSTPETPVTVRGTIEDREYHLAIADQGRGISTENIAEIGPHMQFERKVYEQQGAGLGLVIAKRLTELLGGRFSISSPTGQGTTVSLFFLQAHPRG